MKTIKNEEIRKELDELGSSLPTDQSMIPFLVPDDYFSHFAQDTIKQIDFLKLTGGGEKKENAFIVPDNYFNEFPAKVLEKIYAIPAHEEIEELSPLLAGLRHKETLQMPEGYEFTLKKSGNSKTIPLTPPAYQPEKRLKWVRWVAAAVVIAIFSIGGFSYLNSGSVNSTQSFDQTIAAELDNISDQDIETYLNNNYALNFNAGTSIDASNEALWNGISDKEIEDALNEIFN